MTDQHSLDAAEIEGFRSMVLRFLEQEILPHYDQWEADRIMPRSVWNTMGEAGLLLAEVPEEYGGAGASFQLTQVIHEEMCRLNLHGLATSYNVHANIVAPYIHRFGNEEQKRHYLPRMASGEIVGAIGMTEPGAGSDTAAMRTQAIRDGDDYVINGSKVFITNGIHADLVVLCCKTDPAAGSKGVSLLLVDTHLPGFSRGKKIEKIGQHSSDTAELFFSDMRVPASALLGEEGRGFAYMMQELGRERLGCAAQAVSHAEGALELTIQYVQERKAFGQPLSQFQNTRFKLAEAKGRLEMVRALLEKYTTRYEAGQLTAEEAALIKLTATDMQVDVIDECLQLFGGYGYTDEYPISRFYRDARVQPIYAGTNEIMKELVARGLVGR